ncbi:hypothetical protein GCM10007285_28960 [Stappia taiwanensis]|nr:hypothetical protein GCM10007285_28960 [Stappia taiwanensis]
MRGDGHMRRERPCRPLPLAGTALAAGAVLASLAGVRMAKAMEAVPAPCLAGSIAREVVIADTGMTGDLVTADGALFRQSDLVFPADGPPVLPGNRLPLSLKFADAAEKPDRWNRHLGHFSGDRTGGWLAHALVSSGQAMVAPALSPADCLAPLLSAERQARKERRGLWATERVWSAHRPEDLGPRTGRYTLVSGQVLSVGETRSTLYLNFGHRWSRDFTVTVPAADAPAFAQAGLDLRSLKGTRVRVRGVIQFSGGPGIRVFHPAQIERLDKDNMRQ